MKEKAIELSERVFHIKGVNILTDSKFASFFSITGDSSDFQDALYKKFINSDFLFFTQSYKKNERLLQMKEHLDCHKWIQEADGILNGNLTLLGKKVDPDCGSNQDPINHAAWPKKFYKDVKKSHEIQDCDIKYIWELNRHQYLIVLSKAFWVTGEEKYAEKVFSIIQKWISENPYNTGVNWTSSLELAVRAISWIWCWFLCREAKTLTLNLHFKITKSLYEQGYYIDRHLSYFSSPYNHLIGEAAGLHMIGCFLSMIDKGKYWEKKGWTILENQVENQFHPDGMCVEQASFYHHFTLGFYIQAIMMQNLKGEKISEHVFSRIEKAIEFSIYLTKPDFSLPMIGDIDSARSIYFTSKHSWDFSGLLAIGSVLFNRPDFKNQARLYPEEVFWMLDNDELSRFISMQPEQPQQTSKAFKASGYYILRDSWEKDSHYLCFDCGKVAAGLSEGPVPSAAHGHADALSFELSAFAKPFIVEGGFYTYFGDIEWHKYFRHEEAHNTVQIDDLRQAEYAGRLTWQNVKNPVLKKCGFHGDHDRLIGCLNLNEDVSHTRQIVYVREQFWIVNDIVKNSSPVKIKEIKSFLHFHPLVDIDIDQTDRTITATSGNTGVLIKFFAETKIFKEKGGQKPSCGWTASGYGIKNESWVVELSWMDSIKNSSNINIFSFAIIPWKNNCRNIRIIEKTTIRNQIPAFETAITIAGKDYCVVISEDIDFSLK